jgi:dihydrofolate reductase
MRSLVYHVATTIDNFISHVDGTISDFPDGDHVADYMEHLQKYDTVIMGRGTYEFGYGYGLRPGELAYPWMENYVVSKTLQFDRQNDRLHIVRDNVGAVVSELKARNGSDIYLCGGGRLASYLLDHELIDKLLIKLNPLIYGNGIRLFETSRRTLKLELIRSKAYRSGVVLLEYAINNTNSQ